MEKKQLNNNLTSLIQVMLTKEQNQLNNAPVVVQPASIDSRKVNELLIFIELMEDKFIQQVLDDRYSKTMFKKLRTLVLSKNHQAFVCSQFRRIKCALPRPQDEEIVFQKLFSIVECLE